MDVLLRVWIIGHVRQLHTIFNMLKGGASYCGLEYAALRLVGFHIGLVVVATSVGCCLVLDKLLLSTF